MFLFFTYCVWCCPLAKLSTEHGGGEENVFVFSKLLTCMTGLLNGPENDQSDLFRPAPSAKQRQRHSDGRCGQTRKRTLLVEVRNMKPESVHLSLNAHSLHDTCVKSANTIIVPILL